MQISKFTEANIDESARIGAFDEEKLLLEFTAAALQGAASQLAARHDFKADTLARHAVAVGKAAIEELRRI